MSFQLLSQHLCTQIIRVQLFCPVMYQVHLPGHQCFPFLITCLRPNLHLLPNPLATLPFHWHLLIFTDEGLVVDASKFTVNSDAADLDAFMPQCHIVNDSLNSSPLLLSIIPSSTCWG